MNKEDEMIKRCFELANQLGTVVIYVLMGEKDDK